MLQEHGLLEESAIVTCQEIDLIEGEYITIIAMGYNEIDLVFKFIGTSENGNYNLGAAPTGSADI